MFINNFVFEKRLKLKLLIELMQDEVTEPMDLQTLWRRSPQSSIQPYDVPIILASEASYCSVALL